jgi:hypothetical protein
MKAVNLISRRPYQTVWLVALAMLFLFPALAHGLPPFHECPPIGGDTSCEFLLVIGNSSVTRG